jgi:hypothetical protein
MSEPNTAPKAVVTFKWASVSPDPHNVTMRSNLEPVDIIVAVFVPMQKEYLANADIMLNARETTIKASLDPDMDKAEEEPDPILTREGMRYVVAELSLEVAPEPEVSEEEWGEDKENEAEDAWKNAFGDDDWDEE